VERQGLRKREAVPILDQIESYLNEIRPRVLLKSSLSKALTYARNQRAVLRRYGTNGWLTIDNNISERTLWLQAIGRNYAGLRLMRSCSQHPLNSPFTRAIPCLHGSA
jgi:transposase